MVERQGILIKDLYVYMSPSNWGSFWQVRQCLCSVVCPAVKDRKWRRPGGLWSAVCSVLKVSLVGVCGNVNEKVVIEQEQCGRGKR
jgi:hypothetical protein